MGSKILLGILLGMLAGGSAKDAKNISAESSGFNAPITSSSLHGLISINAAISGIIAISFIIFTFFKYPAMYGFMAVGEVFLGAFIAGLLGYPMIRIIGLSAAPLGVLLWILI